MEGPEGPSEVEGPSELKGPSEVEGPSELKGPSEVEVSSDDMLNALETIMMYIHHTIQIFIKIFCNLD